MKRVSHFYFLLILPLGLGTAFADPLTIDLTTPAPALTAVPIGPGTTSNPQGDKITADSRSILLNDKPIMPIVGEFHFSRYPANEWRTELLKMKAGGITVVSTYVFWIHEEEEKNQFDWSGNRSLRDFLKLCKEVGLQVIVRSGPWDHGESRNGGIPDWVQNSGTHLRSTDPKFLALVRPLFTEEAKQMEGLLWKDGGPVIGIQLDNECGDAAYLLALKEMAISLGIDVPFYTMTGWNQATIPNSGLLPLWSGYTYGFWGGSVEAYRKQVMFSEVRDDGDLNTQMQDVHPERSKHIASFPYLSIEMGAGMASSYTTRVQVDANDPPVVALVKLGSGNNMPGFYMYHGGVNPDGKLSTMQEDHPNQMPLKDYDFLAPLGSSGQIRRVYHLLREQNLFIQDFGSTLASMPAFFPDQRPKDLTDFETLRWSVRANGQGSGFLFFTNRQPYVPMPPKTNVQFSLRTTTGHILLPQTPIMIPDGAYGFWPVNFDCGGIMLAYATVQPLAHLTNADGSLTYFFAALDGIRPELAVDGQSPQAVVPGTKAALSIKNSMGKTITFVVLTPEQAEQFYLLPFGGINRVFLSKVPLYADGQVIHLQPSTVEAFTVSIFPPVPSLKIADTEEKTTEDGVFAEVTTAGLAGATSVEVVPNLQQKAGVKATSLKGYDEGTWKEASVYTLDIPGSAENRKILLNINYIGDAARLYIGNKLFADNFYNGDAFAVPLWRIAKADWPSLSLKILPYSNNLADRLPEETKQKIKAAGADLDKVTIRATEQFDVFLTDLSPKK